MGKMATRRAFHSFPSFEHIITNSALFNSVVTLGGLGVAGIGTIYKVGQYTERTDHGLKKNEESNKLLHADIRALDSKIENKFDTVHKDFINLQNILIQQK